MVYNPETETGYVRLLISDINEPPIFDDVEIGSFLAMERGPKRAAARALLVIAANEVLLAKKISTQDLSTDGPAVAESLRKLAAQLRADADVDDTLADGAWGFDIVPGFADPAFPELTERYSPW